MRQTRRRLFRHFQNRTRAPARRQVQQTRFKSVFENDRRKVKLLRKRLGAGRPRQINSGALALFFLRLPFTAAASEEVFWCRIRAPLTQMGESAGGANFAVRSIPRRLDCPIPASGAARERGCLFLGQSA